MKLIVLDFSKILHIKLKTKASLWTSPPESVDITSSSTHLFGSRVDVILFGGEIYVLVEIVPRLSEAIY